MCFYNDNYEWSASVYHEELRVAVAPRKCRECGEPIQSSNVYRYIFMQEHECCIDCDADVDEVETCTCESPNYGETFETHRCMNCDQFLRAVEAAEKDEGCDSDESRPSLEGMLEEISNLDRHERTKYFRKASRMFPALKSSGYIRRIAAKVY